MKTNKLMLTLWLIIGGIGLINALNIDASIDRARVYLQSLFITTDGKVTSPVKIKLSWTGGHISMSGDLFVWNNATILGELIANIARVNNLTVNNNATVKWTLRARKIYMNGKEVATKEDLQQKPQSSTGLWDIPDCRYVSRGKVCKYWILTFIKTSSKTPPGCKYHDRVHHRVSQYKCPVIGIKQ